MTKHIKYISLLAICFLSLYMHVDAERSACTTEQLKELSKIAYNVKVAYDVEDKSEYKELIAEGDDSTTYKIPNYEFTITLYNVTEDIYVNIEDTAFLTTEQVLYADTNDGTFAFKDLDFGRVHEYIFTINANYEDCYSRQLRTINLTRPKYNAYSEFTYCQNSSIYYCQRFVNSDLNIKGTDDFLQKIYKNNQMNNIEDKNEEQLKSLFTENWKIYVGIFAGVALLFGGFVVYKKKKNKTGGWKL